MVLSGIIEEIVYRNNDNNYTVAVLDVNGEPITCVGRFPPITEGEMVEVNGEFIKHTKYGEQFAVKSIKVSKPTSLEGIVRYLSSGLIKGVGPITALNIVQKFGKDTLDIIEFNPARLSEVKGISANKAQDIGEAFNDIKKMQNSILFLQQYNISTNLAIKIYNIYKDKTEGIVKNNPYKMVEDIDGVGFFTADRIAMEMGIEATSEFRFRAGILHILKENSDKNGNTYMFEANLENELLGLLKITGDSYQEKLEVILQKLEMDTFIKRFEKDDEKVVMLTKYYNVENYVAQTLKLLDMYVDQTNYNIDKEIELYENMNNIKMHEKQKEAVSLAINNGVSIITGGPGTGKTTIIKCILQIFKSMRKKVQLMAPTGRASKRLSESTNQDALTIHRALEVSFNDKNMFYYNQLNKLPYDVIIVDEVSMVDIQLMYYLVRAIKRGARLVLVGDKDQLASVGAGNVLADILKSEQFATLCLTQIYRQDKDSLIITNAHAINNGNMPTFNNKSTDFFFIETDSNESALTNIIQLCTSRLTKFLNCDSSKIQVLAPMKAGVCGIDNINRELQDKINPASVMKMEIVTEKCTYRENDRVMQVSNDYERAWIKDGTIEGSGVFNGDIGVIESIDIQTGELTVLFEDNRRATYLKTDLNELMLSYAITIHKSQGSEFDAVVIPLISGPPMLLTRNLLYTAVTRAKKLVCLVGSKAIIARMVHNNHTVVRFTMLKDFLQEEIKVLGGMNNETE